MKYFICQLYVIGLLLFMSGNSLAAVRVTPYMTLAEEYTDNFYLTDKNKEDDWITTIDPGIGMAYDSNVLQLNLDYSLKFRFHQDHTEDDEKKPSDSQRGSANALLFPERDFRILADGDISRVSVNERGPGVEESEVVNSTNQYRFAVNPQYLWSPVATFSATLGYRYEQFDYDSVSDDVRTDDESGGGDESKSREYSLLLENKLSNTTDLFLRYVYLDYQQQTFQDFDQQTLTAGFTHRLGPRLIVSADGGAVKIDYNDNSDDSSTTWNAQISYTFTAALTLTLTYQKAYVVSVDNGLYETEDASASFVYVSRATIDSSVYWSDDKYKEEDREDKGLGTLVSVTLPLANHYYTSAFFQYEHWKYKPEDEKVDYYAIGTEIGYGFSKGNISLEYTYRENDSDLDGNDYRNNRVILTGSMRY